MSAAPVRVASVAVLSQVLDQRQTLDDALAQNDQFDRLQGADRGMARAIVSAVLRHLGQIDRLASRHLTGRNFRELDRQVQHLLRIGVAQICVLKTPVHAAVSETVDAARMFDEARRAGGLINAVLRKLDPDSLTDLNFPAISAWPKGFQVLMRESLGEKAAMIAMAMQDTPPLDLTVKTDAAGWADKLGGQVVGPSTVRLRSGAVETLPGYEDGAWWVQDIAATLPVHLLAPNSDEAILDLCAAPGGKTLQIAATGARTTAVDRSAKRLSRVKVNLERTGLSATCQAADATKWDSPVLYDGVLVDAPCSALGTLRRHPEGPWIKAPEDLARFPDIQSRLLASAAKRVKPGGRLVYCVCTPLPREGVDIVDAFLKHNDGWARDLEASDLPDPFTSAYTEQGDCLTLPPILEAEGGCDVFYIARLRRKS